ncbi:replication initiation protein [Psychrobacter celer]|jgi:hypothetical protein|uniref:replication initiation protein n=1 Tax=Psychrobacter celer TaxID=306572 RepID=UPI003FD39889
MELLKQVNPDSWEQIPELATIYEALPNTLRCSTIKNNTQYRKKNPSNAQSGHTFAYISYNYPSNTKFIVIDLDYDNALFAYSDIGIPPPTAIARNPANGHCHYIYLLKTAIFYQTAKQQQIFFALAVEQALVRTLNGDRGFTGGLAKNVLSSAHEVFITGSGAYDLHALGDYLDLEKIDYSDASAGNDDVYGRNTSTFDTVRHRAYPLANKYSYDELYKEVLSMCMDVNSSFPDSLGALEVAGIAKSITRFCKGKLFTGIYHERFKERQAKKGSKGGKKSKRKPLSKSERTTKPWEELGISRSTYYRNKKRETNETKTKNSKEPWKLMGVSRSTYYRRLKM